DRAGGGVSAPDGKRDPRSHGRAGVRAAVPRRDPAGSGSWSRDSGFRRRAGRVAEGRPPRELTTSWLDLQVGREPGPSRPALEEVMRSVGIAAVLMLAGGVA